MDCSRVKRDYSAFDWDINKWIKHKLAFLYKIFGLFPIVSIEKKQRAKSKENGQISEKNNKYVDKLMSEVRWKEAL